MAVSRFSSIISRAAAAVVVAAGVLVPTSARAEPVAASPRVVNLRSSDDFRPQPQQPGPSAATSIPGLDQPLPLCDESAEVLPPEVHFPLDAELTESAAKSVPAELIPIFKEAARKVDGLPWMMLAAMAR